MARNRLDFFIFVNLGSVCAFHVFCYAGKCFDTSVIDITFTTPYVFLYLEDVLEKNLKDSFNSSAIKYTL